MLIRYIKELISASSQMCSWMINLWNVNTEFYNIGARTEMSKASEDGSIIAQVESGDNNLSQDVQSALRQIRAKVASADANWKGQASILYKVVKS